VTKARNHLGAWGEALVADWYLSQGFEVLARNWRGAAGELDLVVRRGSTVVFCEVKTRSTTAFGTPAEAVSKAKQARLRTLALAWLAEAQPRVAELRFDVGCVLAGEVDVIEAAF